MSFFDKGGGEGGKNMEEKKTSSSIHSGRGTSFPRSNQRVPKEMTFTEVHTNDLPPPPSPSFFVPTLFPSSIVRTINTKNNNGGSSDLMLVGGGGKHNSNSSGRGGRGPHYSSSSFHEAHLRDFVVVPSGKRHDSLCEEEALSDRATPTGLVGGGGAGGMVAPTSPSPIATLPATATSTSPSGSNSPPNPTTLRVRSGSAASGGAMGAREAFCTIAAAASASGVRLPSPQKGGGLQPHSLLEPVSSLVSFPSFSSVTLPAHQQQHPHAAAAGSAPQGLHSLNSSGLRSQRPQSSASFLLSPASTPGGDSGASPRDGHPSSSSKPLRSPYRRGFQSHSAHLLKKQNSTNHSHNHQHYHIMIKNNMNQLPKTSGANNTDSPNNSCSSQSSGSSNCAPEGILGQRSGMNSMIRIISHEVRRPRHPLYPSPHKVGKNETSGGEGSSISFFRHRRSSSAIPLPSQKRETGEQRERRSRSLPSASSRRSTTTALTSGSGGGGGGGGPLPLLTPKKSFLRHRSSSSSSFFPHPLRRADSRRSVHRSSSACGSSFFSAGKWWSPVTPEPPSIVLSLPPATQAAIDMIVAAREDRLRGGKTTSTEVQEGGRREAQKEGGGSGEKGRKLGEVGAGGESGLPPSFSGSSVSSVPFHSIERTGEAAEEEEKRDALTNAFSSSFLSSTSSPVARRDGGGFSSQNVETKCAELQKDHLAQLQKRHKEVWNLFSLDSTKKSRRKKMLQKEGTRKMGNEEEEDGGLSPEGERGERLRTGGEGQPIIRSSSSTGTPRDASNSSFLLSKEGEAQLAGSEKESSWVFPGRKVHKGGLGGADSNKRRREHDDADEEEEEEEDMKLTLKQKIKKKRKSSKKKSSSALDVRWWNDLPLKYSLPEEEEDDEVDLEKGKVGEKKGKKGGWDKDKEMGAREIHPPYFSREDKEPLTEEKEVPLPPHPPLNLVPYSFFSPSSSKGMTKHHRQYRTLPFQHASDTLKGGKAAADGGGGGVASITSTMTCAPVNSVKEKVEKPTTMMNNTEEDDEESVEAAAKTLMNALTTNAAAAATVAPCSREAPPPQSPPLFLPDTRWSKCGSSTSFESATVDLLWDIDSKGDHSHHDWEKKKKGKKKREAKTKRDEESIITATATAAVEEEEEKEKEGEEGKRGNQWKRTHASRKKKKAKREKYSSDSSVTTSSSRHGSTSSSWSHPHKLQKRSGGTGGVPPYDPSHPEILAQRLQKMQKKMLKKGLLLRNDASLAPFTAAASSGFGRAMLTGVAAAPAAFSSSSPFLSSFMTTTTPAPLSPRQQQQLLLMALSGVRSYSSVSQGPIPSWVYSLNDILFFHNSSPIHGPPPRCRRRRWWWWWKWCWGSGGDEDREIRPTDVSSPYRHPVDAAALQLRAAIHSLENLLTKVEYGVDGEKSWFVGGNRGCRGGRPPAKKCEIFSSIFFDEVLLEKESEVEEGRKEGRGGLTTIAAGGGSDDYNNDDDGKEEKIREDASGKKKRKKGRTSSLATQGNPPEVVEVEEGKAAAAALQRHRSVPHPLASFPPSKGGVHFQEENEPIITTVSHGNGAKEEEQQQPIQHDEAETERSALLKEITTITKRSKKGNGGEELLLFIDNIPLDKEDLNKPVLAQEIPLWRRKGAALQTIRDALLLLENRYDVLCSPSFSLLPFLPSSSSSASSTSSWSSSSTLGFSARDGHPKLLGSHQQESPFPSWGGMDDEKQEQRHYSSPIPATQHRVFVSGKGAGLEQLSLSPSHYTGVDGRQALHLPPAVYALFTSTLTQTILSDVFGTSDSAFPDRACRLLHAWKTQLPMIHSRFLIEYPFTPLYTHSAIRYGAPWDTQRRAAAVSARAGGSPDASHPLVGLKSWRGQNVFGSNKESGDRPVSGTRPYWCSPSSILSSSPRLVPGGNLRRGETGYGSSSSSTSWQTPADSVRRRRMEEGEEEGRKGEGDDGENPSSLQSYSIHLSYLRLQPSLMGLEYVGKTFLPSSSSSSSSLSAQGRRTRRRKWRRRRSEREREGRIRDGSVGGGGGGMGRKEGEGKEGPNVHEKRGRISPSKKTPFSHEEPTSLPIPSSPSALSSVLSPSTLHRCPSPRFPAPSSALQKGLAGLHQSWSDWLQLQDPFSVLEGNSLREGEAEHSATTTTLPLCWGSFPFSTVEGSLSKSPPQQQQQQQRKGKKKKKVCIERNHEVPENSVENEREEGGGNSSRSSFMQGQRRRKQPHHLRISVDDTAEGGHSYFLLSPSRADSPSGSKQEQNKNKKKPSNRPPSRRGYAPHSLKNNRATSNDDEEEDEDEEEEDEEDAATASTPLLGYAMLSHILRYADQLCYMAHLVVAASHVVQSTPRPTSTSHSGPAPLVSFSVEDLLQADLLDHFEKYRLLRLNLLSNLKYRTFYADQLRLPHLLRHLEEEEGNERNKNHFHHKSRNSSEWEAEEKEEGKQKKNWVSRSLSLGEEAPASPGAGAGTVEHEEVSMWNSLDGRALVSRLQALHAESCRQERELIFHMIVVWCAILLEREVNATNREHRTATAAGRRRSILSSSLLLPPSRSSSSLSSTHGDILRFFLVHHPDTLKKAHEEAVENEDGEGSGVFEHRHKTCKRKEKSRDRSLLSSTSTSSSTFCVTAASATTTPTRRGMLYGTVKKGWQIFSQESELKDEERSWRRGWGRRVGEGGEDDETEETTAQVRSMMVESPPPPTTTTITTESPFLMNSIPMSSSYVSSFPLAPVLNGKEGREKYSARGGGRRTSSLLREKMKRWWGGGGGGGGGESGVSKSVDSDPAGTCCTGLGRPPSPFIPSGVLTGAHKEYSTLWTNANQTPGSITMKMMALPEVIRGGSSNVGQPHPHPRYPPSSHAGNEVAVFMQERGKRTDEEEEEYGCARSTNTSSSSRRSISSTVDDSSRPPLRQQTLVLPPPLHLSSIFSPGTRKKGGKEIHANQMHEIPPQGEDGGGTEERKDPYLWSADNKKYFVHPAPMMGETATSSILCPNGGYPSVAGTRAETGVGWGSSRSSGDGGGGGGGGWRSGASRMHPSVALTSSTLTSTTPPFYHTEGQFRFFLRLRGGGNNNNHGEVGNGGEKKRKNDASDKTHSSTSSTSGNRSRASYSSGRSSPPFSFVIPPLYTSSLSSLSKLPPSLNELGEKEEQYHERQALYASDPSLRRVSPSDMNFEFPYVLGTDPLWYEPVVESVDSIFVMESRRTKGNEEGRGTPRVPCPASAHSPPPVGSPVYPACHSLAAEEEEEEEARERDGDEEEENEDSSQGAVPLRDSGSPSSTSSSSFVFPSHPPPSLLPHIRTPPGRGSRVSNTKGGIHKNQRGGIKRNGRKWSGYSTRATPHHSCGCCCSGCRRPCRHRRTPIAGHAATTTTTYSSSSVVWFQVLLFARFAPASINVRPFHVSSSSSSWGLSLPSSGHNNGGGGVSASGSIPQFIGATRPRPLTASKMIFFNESFEIRCFSTLQEVLLHVVPVCCSSSTALFSSPSDSACCVKEDVSISLSSPAFAPSFHFPPMVVSTLHLYPAPQPSYLLLPMEPPTPFTVFGTSYRPYPSGWQEEVAKKGKVGGNPPRGGGGESHTTSAMMNPLLAGYIAASTTWTGAFGWSMEDIEQYFLTSLHADPMDPGQRCFMEALRWWYDERERQEVAAAGFHRRRWKRWIDRESKCVGVGNGVGAMLTGGGTSANNSLHPSYYAVMETRRGGGLLPPPRKRLSLMRSSFPSARGAAFYGRRPTGPAVLSISVDATAAGVPHQPSPALPLRRLGTASFSPSTTSALKGRRMKWQEHGMAAGGGNPAAMVGPSEEEKEGNPVGSLSKKKQKGYERTVAFATPSLSGNPQRSASPSSVFSPTSVIPRFPGPMMGRQKLRGKGPGMLGMAAAAASLHHPSQPSTFPSFPASYTPAVAATAGVAGGGSGGNMALGEGHLRAVEAEDDSVGSPVLPAVPSVERWNGSLDWVAEWRWFRQGPEGHSPVAVQALYECHRFQLLQKRWEIACERAKPDSLLESRIFYFPIPLLEEEHFRQLRKMEKEIHRMNKRLSPSFPVLEEKFDIERYFSDPAAISGLAYAPIPKEQKAALWKERLRRLALTQFSESSAREMSDEKLLARYVTVPKLVRTQITLLKPRSGLNPRRVERPKTEEIDRQALKKLVGAGGRGGGIGKRSSPAHGMQWVKEKRRTGSGKTEGSQPQSPFPSASPSPVCVVGQDGKEEESSRGKTKEQEETASAPPTLSMVGMAAAAVAALLNGYSRSTRETMNSPFPSPSSLPPLPSSPGEAAAAASAAAEGKEASSSFSYLQTLGNIVFSSASREHTGRNASPSFPLPPPSSSPSPFLGSSSYITLHLMKISNLPEREDGSPLEPFVVLSFVHETACSRSTVGTSPSYFQSLHIPFDPCNFEEETLRLIDDDIVITVYDKREIPMPVHPIPMYGEKESHYRTERRFLCSLRIPFAALHEAEEARLESVFPLDIPRWVLGYRHVGTSQDKTRRKMTMCLQGMHGAGVPGEASARNGVGGEPSLLSTQPWGPFNWNTVGGGVGENEEGRERNTGRGERSPSVSQHPPLGVDGPSSTKDATNALTSFIFPPPPPRDAEASPSSSSSAPLLPRPPRSHRRSAQEDEYPSRRLRALQTQEEKAEEERTGMTFDIAGGSGVGRSPCELLSGPGSTYTSWKPHDPPTIHLYLSLWPPLQRPLQQKHTFRELQRDILPTLYVGPVLARLHQTALRWKKEGEKRIASLVKLNHHAKKRHLDPFVRCSTGDFFLICRYLLPEGCAPPRERVTNVYEAIRFTSLLPYVVNATEIGEVTGEEWSPNGEMIAWRSRRYVELGILLWHFLRYLAPGGGGSGHRHGAGGHGHHDRDGKGKQQQREEEEEEEEVYLVNGEGHFYREVMLVLHRLGTGVHWHLIDPMTGAMTRVESPHGSLIRDVRSVFSPFQIWANIQVSGLPHRMSWDLEDRRHWLPCFTPEESKELSLHLAPIQRRVLHFSPVNLTRAKIIEVGLQEALRKALRAWRPHHPPCYRRALSELFRNALIRAEEERCQSGEWHPVLTRALEEELWKYLGEDEPVPSPPTSQGVFSLIHSGGVGEGEGEGGGKSRASASLRDSAPLIISSPVRPTATGVDQPQSVRISSRRYGFTGVPVTATYHPADTHFHYILDQVYQSAVHEVSTDDVGFALGVYVKSYGGDVFAMNVFLVAIFTQKGLW